ncbi:MAG TPA: hypothetical protein VFU73_08970 [Actinocrinis sp.]|nr:hypothetical protein [Actinocrinis sp.]
MRIDVHQHLWSPPFVEALRARSGPPRLSGWTLELAGEPAYRVAPQDHEIGRRLELNRADGLDLALVSLSSPLGIELLPPDEAAPLLEAYHEGALALPDGFGVWAAGCVSRPDPKTLEALLETGCVGLQLPATALADRAGYEHCEPLLRVLEERGRPLFVHPGAASMTAAAPPPPWWAAAVDYVHQMHAAYFAFAAFGRPAHPALKICFAMLAGLAPTHRERVRARGGPVGATGTADAPADQGTWFETSSYGDAALAAMTGALGEAGGGLIVLGSDRPYAAPTRLPDEEAAARAAAALLEP